MELQNRDFKTTGFKAMKFLLCLCLWLVVILLQKLSKNY